MRRYYYYIIIIVILILFFFIRCNQNKNPYQQDVAYYFKTLRTVHVAPYQYISPDSLDLLEKQIQDRTEQMRNVYDLNVNLMRLNQYFDGHTGCYIYPDLFVLMSDCYLPCEIRNDSMFWQPTGEQVISLDTFTVSQYLHEVKKFIPHDLSKENKNVRCLNYRYYCMLNNLKPLRYCMLYNSTDKKIYKQPFEIRKFMYKKEKEIPPFVLRYFAKDSTAYLGYNTANPIYIKILSDTLNVFFDSLKKMSVKHLFIDVRNNGGGSDYTNNTVIKHLALRESNYITTHETSGKGKRMFITQMWKLYKEHVPQWKLGWIMLKTYFEKQESITSVYTNPQPSGFDGKIYVLQGRKTFSAGYDFCYILRIAGYSVHLIGETVGQYNPICGNLLTLKLPNTKIPFYIATRKTYNKNGLPEKDGFLLPDVPFHFQFQDSLTLQEMTKIKKLCTK